VAPAAAGGGCFQKARVELCCPPLTHPAPPAPCPRDAPRAQTHPLAGSRFIINIPEAELSTPARLLFQIEQAHWFYEDFVRQEAPALPSLSLWGFASRLLAHVGLPMGQEQFRAFIDYKVRVPVCGGIILSERGDEVLLVRGFRDGSSWSFPRGGLLLLLLLLWSWNEGRLTCRERWPTMLLACKPTNTPSPHTQP
jgi:hypothetical protein